MNGTMSLNSSLFTIKMNPFSFYNIPNVGWESIPPHFPGEDLQVP